MTGKIYYAWVYGRKEKLHKLTPKQILDDLMLCINEEIEWKISPEELIGITIKPEFPLSFANAIRITILDYCTDKAIDLAVIGSKGNGEDVSISVLSYCYFTVIGRAGGEAKARYRQAILNTIVDKFTVKDQRWHDQWKDMNLSSAGTFLRNFGPEPSRWPMLIKHRYEEDLTRHLADPKKKTGN